MIKSVSSSRESGFADRLALVGVALAVCAAVVLGATSALTAPAPVVSAGPAPVGYLPAQLVNQATEIEPMPATF